MGEAIDRARAIITAMAEGLTQEELTEEGMAMAEDLIGEIEAEVATTQDREAASERVGQLVTALAHLAVHIAQMPAVAFNRLARAGIVIPPDAVVEFSDAQTTLATAFTLAEMEPE